MIIPMVFRHFCGEDICRTADEVKAAFSKHINGVNQFFISNISDKLYPYLSVESRISGVCGSYRIRA